jgi:hypothetical protein
VTSAVAIVSIVPVPNLSVGPTSTNFTISGIGIPGSYYFIQVTTNIIARDWVTIATNTVPPSGVITFTDTNNPAALPSEYYRIQFP